MIEFNQIITFIEAHKAESRMLLDTLVDEIKLQNARAEAAEDKAKKADKRTIEARENALATWHRENDARKRAEVAEAHILEILEERNIFARYVSATSCKCHQFLIGGPCPSCLAKKVMEDVQ